mgnify:CR=1 FL=1
MGIKKIKRPRVMMSTLALRKSSIEAMTSSSGFLGSHLCDKLLANVHRLPSGNRSNKAKNQEDTV